MNTELVAITKPLVKGITTAEEFVVYCARVSNPSNQLNTETAPRLLRYLVEHKHWSPFEKVSCTFEIETSRAIAAQILRHRSFSFQEFSQRYSTAELGFEEVEPRKQAQKNRQSSTDLVDDVHAQLFERQWEDLRIKAETLYEDALRWGIAREVARFVLPLATTTRLYMSGTLRSFLHYVDVRCAPETQKEHRVIAKGIRDALCREFPVVAEALGWKS